MRQILFLCIFLVPFSYAQGNSGTAEYAMLHPNWPCKEARESEDRNGIKNLRKAILWNTFGNNTACLEQYLSDERLKFLEVHLINEVCQRNKNCGEYEFLYGINKNEYENKLINNDPELFSKLLAYLKPLSSILNSKLKSHTACYISPGLESNLSKEAVKSLIRQIKPEFPKCKIVWNPVDSNPDAFPIRGTVFEVHGEFPQLKPPCIADLDGVDINFPSRKALSQRNIDHSAIPAYFDRFKACEAAFLWISEFNGIKSDDFMDPRQRTAFPDSKTLDLLNEIAAKYQ